MEPKCISFSLPLPARGTALGCSGVTGRDCYSKNRLNVGQGGLQARSGTLLQVGGQFIWVTQHVGLRAEVSYAFQMSHASALYQGWLYMSRTCSCGLKIEPEAEAEAEWTLASPKSLSLWPHEPAASLPAPGATAVPKPTMDRVLVAHERRMSCSPHSKGKFLICVTISLLLVSAIQPSWLITIVNYSIFWQSQVLITLFSCPDDAFFLQNTKISNHIIQYLNLQNICDIPFSARKYKKGLILALLP